MPLPCAIIPRTRGVTEFVRSLLSSQDLCLAVGAPVTSRILAPRDAPFPILADPSHDVYHRFDLERAYLLIQRTASVVVDRSGRIACLRRATNALTWLQESQEPAGRTRAG